MEFDAGKTNMKKSIITITILSVTAAMICLGIYNDTKHGALLAAAITFGTTAYHFLMRLSVGFLFDKTMNNRADYTKSWYQCRTWETKLYERLHVKRWKRGIPTYDSSLFDCKKHSWHEIVQASCQAELVHEVIALLSFLPILFSVWFDATAVFLITSVLAASVDITFVIIQRYNRPRMMRLIGR